MMIFADKLTQLRKKCGWSQEELAQKLDVTRQSVSKWEGAQSIPELDKILQISRIFGVSTDYLLRDELEESGPADEQPEAAPVRRVSMEDASAFLRATEQITLPYTLAVFLCIFSPIPLLMLGGASTESILFRPISESLAGGAGVIILLLLVAAAVAIFLWCGEKTKRFEFLETEDFETEYGVAGMVRARQEQLRPHYVRGNAIGAVLCVLSPIPLLCGAFLAESTFILTSLVACLLLMVGVAVVFFMRNGCLWESMEKLLQENDYTQRSKRVSRATRYVAPIYWVTGVAIYVGYSLATENWGISWVIWPVWGLLFVPVRLTARALAERKLDK